MKLNRWLIPAALAVLTMAAGCKKDDDTKTKSLSGEVELLVPQFVEPGYTKTFAIDTLMTLSCPDGYPVGYYFTDPATSKRDTLVDVNGKILKKTFTFTAADKLAEQTLTVTGFVSPDAKYSSKTASAKFLIVRSGLDGTGSITKFETSASSGSFKDARDGREYYYKQLGDQSWMRHNLAWTGAGRAFLRYEVMNDIFGRYYTWEEAQTACPEGWRLPTDAEWTALSSGAEAGKDIPGLAGKVMGDLYFNGSKMWEYWREVKITDEYRLSVIPSGYGVVSGDGTVDFKGLYTYAAFWTSDEAAGKGVCRYIYQDKDVVYRGLMSKTDFAASVRCVKQ